MFIDQTLSTGNLLASSDSWTAVESAELYRVDRWSGGYFSVSKRGFVLVHPELDPKRAVNLHLLVDELRQRGIELPVLLRFGGILEHRVRALHEAFADAREESGYRGGHSLVFPVKVNPQRRVVEGLLAAGERFGYGLETGSKAELLAVLAMSEPETPVVCNGFKDVEVFQTVLLAQKLGRQVVPVIERFDDLTTILDLSEEFCIEPRFGMRLKLASEGAGRWRESAGYRSKFGLTVGGVLEAIKLLSERGRLRSLRLLHFHLGSQITSIRQIKSGVQEAARIYVQLVALGADRLDTLDVGGGLGIDYDGAHTDRDSSVNYSLQEYANAVVHHTQLVCDQAGVEHPLLISESGRAVSAHHSVLLFEALGCDSFEPRELPACVDPRAPQPIMALQETMEELTATERVGERHIDQSDCLSRLTEALHDAQQSLEQALSLFGLGYLTLEQRGLAEDLYWAVCQHVQRLSARLERRPLELLELEHRLPDIYFCNFSVFQSLPDAWAIRQQFPILPIHRLEQRPTRKATLADISCDSDGKVDRFIGSGGDRGCLAVHSLVKGERYVLGAFLVGSYQEVLGGLHNLFGEAHTVRVELDEGGSVVIEEAVRGQSVEDVLAVLEYQGAELVERFSGEVEGAVQSGLLGEGEARRLLDLYRRGLSGYTYLG